MADLTLKQLRARAKRLGIAGYSRMTKTALERQLHKHAAKKPIATGSKKKKQRPKKLATRRAAPASRATPTATPVAPTPGLVWWEPRPATNGDIEQRIESAKYTLPPDVSESAGATDLGEDIERLPVLAEPLLCLLSQKPGVLYACWAFGELDLPTADLRLRLLCTHGAVVTVWEERPLPAARGHWYFHVPTDLKSADVTLHVGFYKHDAFVTVWHADAQLSRRDASPHTDPRRFIGLEEFRRMYLRAGGLAEGTTADGIAASSSPGRWPNAASSR